jgi:hypothetical protein
MRHGGHALRDRAPAEKRRDYSRSASDLTFFREFETEWRSAPGAAVRRKDGDAPERSRWWKARGSGAAGFRFRNEIHAVAL